MNLISLKKIKINTDPNRVRRALKRAHFTSLGKAAGTIRRIAMNSIKQSPKAEPGPEGGPPRTRLGQLKKSIRYVVDKERGSMVVGPGRSAIALIGAIHEHGRTVKAKPRVVGVYSGGVKVGQMTVDLFDKPYPKRPFMRPAFEKVRDRLPEFWANSFVEG